MTGFYKECKDAKIKINKMRGQGATNEQLTSVIKKQYCFGDRLINRLIKESMEEQ